MPRKTPPRQQVDLQKLLARLHQVNPTGRTLVRPEEQARYAEKARLQSLLIESYPDEVRVRHHPEMPGIVSLSVPRLQASAGHAVIDALSSAARHWLETQSHLPDEPYSEHEPAVHPRKTSSLFLPVARAEKHLADYDFECAISTLEDALQDATIGKEERLRALQLLLEIHVDHLANDEAALDLEPTLRSWGGLSARAHELLGLAASRKGDIPRALQHLGKSRGERVGAEIAAIVRTSFVAEQWSLARKAWTQLNALVASTEAPLSTSLAALRNDLRDMFVRGAIEKLETNAFVDEELERIIREFAPNHPAYLTRRQAERKTRFEYLLRSSLQKAREAKNNGDFEEVFSCTDGLDAAGLSVEDASEVDKLRTWAEERRAIGQATRAMALAQLPDLEDACHAYLNLSSRAREHLGEQEQNPLFLAIEQLNATNPERTNTRPLLRAACAWAQAARTSDPIAMWTILAPHAGWFDRIPLFAERLQTLQSRADALRAELGASHCAETNSAASKIRENQSLSEWTRRPPPFRIERVARHAVRFGTGWFVPSVGQTVDTNEWLVSFWPCHASGEPLHISLPEIPSNHFLRIIGQKQRAVLLDDENNSWLVDPANKPMVCRTKLLFAPDLEREFSFLPVDDEHFALGPPGDRASNLPWRIVHIPSGTIRTELSGPGLHFVRTNGGGTFYRLSGLCLERLDLDGRVGDHFELPKNITPLAFIEMPGAMRPVILGTAILRSCVLAWWQPEPRFFRSFELFDMTDHGELVDVWSLARKTSSRSSKGSNGAMEDGGVFAMTRKKDGKIFVHDMIVKKGILLSGGHQSSSFQTSIVLGDPTGKWAWIMSIPRPDTVEIQAWTPPNRDE